MARLTKTDQVLPTIRLFRCLELSKGSDVIDGQRPTNERRAVGAMAALLNHDAHPGALPIAATVGLRTAYPIGRVRAGQSDATMLGPARLRAVEVRGAGVSCLPRLLQERTATVQTFEADRVTPARVALSKLPANLEARSVRPVVWPKVVGRGESLASTGTEPSAPTPRLRFKHLPLRATVLAGSGQPDWTLGLFHPSIIPGFMGIGWMAYLSAAAV